MGPAGSEHPGPYDSADRAGAVDRMAAQGPRAARADNHCNAADCAQAFSSSQDPAASAARAGQITTAAQAGSSAATARAAAGATQDSAQSRRDQTAASGGSSESLPGAGHTKASATAQERNSAEYLRFRHLGQANSEGTIAQSADRRIWRS